MKKFIKSNLKGFMTIVICGMVFTSITAYAATQYYAKDINFTSTNEGWKPGNVENALNDLYGKISNVQQVRFCAHSWNSAQGGANIDFSNYNYKKLKIIEFNYMEQSTAQFYFTDKDYNKISAELNEEYSLIDSNINYLYVTEQVNSSYGFACLVVEFYN